jgi:hypothetical protein
VFFLIVACLPPFKKSTWQRSRSFTLLCRQELRPFCPTNISRKIRELGLKMFSFVARSANLSSTVAATQSVANGSKALSPAVSIHIERALVPPPAQKLTTNSLTAGLPINPIRASVSIGGNVILFDLITLFLRISYARI